MKINGKTTTATKFAFDGCHKIYLLESSEDEGDAIDNGYIVFPICKLQQKYRNSCGLRFISNWSLTKSFVEQFEDAKFI